MNKCDLYNCSLAFSVPNSQDTQKVFLASFHYYCLIVLTSLHTVCVNQNYRRKFMVVRLIAHDLSYLHTYLKVRSAFH